MQMVPWLHFLLMRFFEFHQKKMTLFSNRNSFFDFDGNFQKKNFKIFFPKNAPGVSGASAKGSRSISQLV